ncbi:pilus assembly protein CpaF [Thermoleophilum album]|uniref:Pilus assembly protein CpaF n=1 Tax=Thermoleophilum album TaxID=29539 RepID=A0A1H6FX68_THEAL|nr:pilus assembly protein CpaF [Thermoleophilum album]
MRERLLAAAPANAGAHEDPRLEVERVVAEEAGTLPAPLREALVHRLLVLAQGLGPLELLLADESIDEIMVNGYREIWVEREGRLERVASAFSSDRELRNLIERILAPLGRRVDEAHPICDARLADGSRVNVILPPLSVDGVCLTIRRFRPRRFTLAELAAKGALPAPLAEYLATATRSRRSLLVSGGTGSGKTTLLGALCAEIDASERLITIEDAAELRLERPHVVRLEARPPNLEGKGEVTIRQLVRNALRMRPDRIVVGEVRGGEALDMLQAMNTGHEGSLSTIHANSPQDALRRLETLALMADVDLPHGAIRAQVESALDLVVHMQRAVGGARVVAEVVELARDGQLGCRTLWRREGRALDGPDAAATASPGADWGSPSARVEGAA